MKNLLEIIDLHVSIDDKKILNGLNLTINRNQVHAIMGPNGSGKSTLSYVLAGRDGYEVTGGDILVDGKSILDLDTSERANLGMFLAFQYPVELPGVTGTTFLRSMLNSKLKTEGKEEVDQIEFIKFLREKANEVGISSNMLKRAVNVGFSGGEKKRYEILQMMLLNPKLSILDETDSGLDIDALKVVSEGVNSQRNKNCGMMVITHYQRLLSHIVPDFVHILMNGKIIKSGDKNLAIEIEKNGYSGLGDAAWF